MSDLKSKKLIYLKGFLFFAIVLTTAIIIVLETQSWKIAALLALLIWASARAYYFMFYVIEKYVDPNYKFAGVFDFAKYACSRKKGHEDP